MLPKYKDIIDLLKKGATIEAQEKIMELREAAIELQDENQELREKISKLEKELEIKGNIEWDKPYYWLLNGQEGTTLSVFSWRQSICSPCLRHSHDRRPAIRLVAISFAP